MRQLIATLTWWTGGHRSKGPAKRPKQQEEQEDRKEGEESKEGRGAEERDSTLFRELGLKLKIRQRQGPHEKKLHESPRKLVIPRRLEGRMGAGKRKRD